jgi:hypothetical protein
MEASMTKDQLAEKLAHLDPGATLTVEEGELAQIFGAGLRADELVQAAETFAVEHRCAFSYHEHGRVVPTFEKNDIF